MKFDANMQSIEGVILNALHDTSVRPSYGSLKMTERLLYTTIEHQIKEDSKRLFGIFRGVSRTTRRFMRMLDVVYVLLKRTEGNKEI